MRFNTILMIIW